MSDISIVTAFFDIGRENSSTSPRTKTQYFENFKFWARIKNRLFVFCAPNDVDEVISIRKSFGLEKQTIVIPIENIYKIESEIFSKMATIEKDPDYCNFRFKSEEISNTAKYNYIMFLKAWFINEASKQCSEDSMVAWIDFGFNHGGKYYTDPQNFDFLWDFEFDPKINVFCLSEPEQYSCINMLQFQAECFIGGSYIMPQYFCEKWWQEIRDSMLSLLSLDCMDDDQLLMHMIYKRLPDEFIVRICDWFEAFKLCSNQTFSIIEKNVNIQTRQTINKSPILLRLIRKVYTKLKSITRKKSSIPKPHPFIEKSIERMKKYRNV